MELWGEFEEWQRKELKNVRREMEAEMLSKKVSVLEAQFRALASAQSKHELFSPEWQWYLPRVYGAWVTWQTHKEK